ncbi:MAG TPA: M20/M25/M40 family metallo-hydrolase [Holophagaceae bacterium]|nr:M20/M25/M40 family metallo-hydrolase [Holophagaceae bacterium]
MKRLRAALAASTVLLSAQAPDAARMKADVYTLASPAFEGRLTGTPGQMKAARLVAERFKELGLQPLGKGAEPYFLPYALELRTASETGSSFVLEGHRVPFGPGAATFRLAPLETRLLFVPEGVDPGPSAKGRWLARFAPAGAEPDGDLLMKAALASGASGLVLLPRLGADTLGHEREQGQRFIQRGRYGFPGDGPAPKGPAEAALDEASARALGLDLVALSKAVAPVDLGAFQITPNMSLTTLNPVNVAGLLRGSDPVLKDEIVVLSAHEDHLGFLHGQLHPGADDNASGTAVLMEAARLLKDAKPRRSILFLSVSGEELGLFGSRAFVADPPVPLKSIVADLNTDMVGRNGIRTIAVTPARIEGATGTLTRDARSIAADLGFTLTDEADEYWKRSDHYTFAQAGIPAIFFFGGMEADYHQATDTPDKIEPEKLANVAELLRRLTLRIANADARPQALPDEAWKSWAWPSR